MRYITRFTSADGVLSLDLPLTVGEQSEGQAVRKALAKAALLSYAADLQSPGLVVPDTAEVRLRATLYEPTLDSTLDQIRALLRKIGRGKLWMRLSDGTERWCWARADDLGSWEVSAEHPVSAGFTVSFTRLSDWYAAAPQQVVLAVSGTALVQVTVAGVLPTRNITIEMEATAAGGFANPVVENVALGLSFSVAATAAAAGDRIRVAPSHVVSWRAQYYDGTSWTDVPAIPGPAQAVLLELEPGRNVLRISSCPAATVTIRWFEAYP